METFTDDTVVALASFLSPCDMLNLALTCKRFGDSNGTTTNTDKKRSADRGEGTREVRQRTESIDRNHDMYASSLALTCKRFGAKNSGTSRREARQQSSGTTNTCKEIMSLMEVAARTVLFAKATEDERNALPRRGDESWIGVYITSFYQYSVHHCNSIKLSGIVFIMLRDKKNNSTNNRRSYTSSSQGHNCYLQ